jgi:hypothetical protein
MNDIQKARELLFENTPVTKIFDTYILPDAVDFICCCGGDSVIYRVYDDGRIVER